MTKLSYQATHITVDNLDTPYKRVYSSLKAMTNIVGYSNGTLRNPSELASSEVNLYQMKGGWIKASSSIPYNAKPVGKCNLIEAVFAGYEVEYNDGWFIFEIDEDYMYVDFTAFATRKMKENGELNYYTIFDNTIDEETVEFAKESGIKIKKDTYKVVLD